MKRAFWAEYQNEPLPRNEGDCDHAHGEQIAAKTNGHPRGEIPIGANHLTMFIDVQGKMLFWLVCAWEDDFTGYVVDYGTWPISSAVLHAARRAKTLARAAPARAWKGDLCRTGEADRRDLLSRAWRRDDGAELRIDRCLIDANWGQSYRRGLPVLPAEQARERRAAQSRALRRRVKHPVQRVQAQARRSRRVITGAFPTIRQAPGAARADRHQLLEELRPRPAGGSDGRSGLPVAVRAQARRKHQLLAEHLTAEYRVNGGAGPRGGRMEAPRRCADNHWLDCLVGCAVAASIQGAVLPGTEVTAAPARQRIRLSEVQRSRR
jgi:hypothetical protein